MFDKLHIALAASTTLLFGIAVGMNDKFFCFSFRFTYARQTQYTYIFHYLTGHAITEHSYRKRQVGRGKGHYSKAVVANGLVFVSGILPIKHSGNDSTKLTNGTFEEQTKLVLERLKSTLEDSGSALRKLVSVRVYIDDISNWTSFNEIYAKFLGDNNLPARAVVPVSELHYGLKIELEAIAMY